MDTEDVEVVCISSDSESEEIILISDSDAETSHIGSVPRELESWHTRAWKDSEEQRFEAELQLALEVSLKEYQEQNPQPSTSGENGAKEKDPPEKEEQNLQKGYGSRLKGESKSQKSWSRYKAEKEKEKRDLESTNAGHVTHVSREMHKLKLRNSTVTSVKSDWSDVPGYSVPRKKMKFDMGSKKNEEENMAGELVFKSFRSSPRIYDGATESTSSRTEHRSPSLLTCSNVFSNVGKNQPRTPKKKMTFVKIECPREDELSDSLPDLEEIDVELKIESEFHVKSPQRTVGPVYSDISSDDDDGEQRRRNGMHYWHHASEHISVYSDISEEEQEGDTKGESLHNPAYSDISSGEDISDLEEGTEVIILDGTPGDLAPDQVQKHTIAPKYSMTDKQDRHFSDILSPAKKIKLDCQNDLNSSSSEDLPVQFCRSVVDHKKRSSVNSRGSTSSLESLALHETTETGEFEEQKIPATRVLQKENLCPSPVMKPCSVICKKLKTKESTVTERTDILPKTSTLPLMMTDVAKAATCKSPSLREIKLPADTHVQSSTVRHGRLRQVGFQLKRSPMVQCDMRKFLEASPKKVSMAFIDATQNRKILHPAFLSDFALPERTAAAEPEALEFSATQGCTIDACMEEGIRFIDHVLDLVQGFALYNKPSAAIVQYIYNTGLAKSKCISQSHKAFNILSYIQRKYPHAVKVDWHMVATLVENLGLNKASQTADKCTIVNSTLGLQLILQVLHGDLQHRDLSDHKLIRTSLAYKVLLGDHQFNRLKNVMDWINCVLNCGEYEEVRESYLTLHLRGTADAPQRGLQQDPGQVEPTLQELKTVLPFLQQLLEIGIIVSESNIDCAKRLALEFVRIVYYLPNLEHKKLLLQTMSSDLLRFKVCQLFLEAHCDSPQCCEDFPYSLRDVLECFEAVPPKSHLTPPLTPSEDDHDIFDMVHVSPQSCEQLVMLQYYVIYSYIKSSRGQSYKALRRRARSTDVQFELSHEDKRLLRDEWGNFIESLRLKILELAGDITPVTERYLSMILCLGMNV